MKTTLGQLRLLAILEAVSWVALLATMYMKYAMEIKQPNKIAGMIHGLLFVAYCLWVFLVRSEKAMSTKTTFLVLTASIFPFMTIWADMKFLKPLDVKN